MRILVKARVWAVSVFTLAIALAHGGSLAANDDATQSDSYIQQGFAIAPVPLNLAGKNPALVGLGSYIANTSGCNDCHTWQNWAPGGDPYVGQSPRINASVYLAGGRPFGPTLRSKNITPDINGLPAGLTLAEFTDLFYTGRDPDDGHILQVMPWPLLRLKTEHDLRAVYEYLRAIPPLPNNY